MGWFHTEKGLTQAAVDLPHRSALMPGATLIDRRQPRLPLASPSAGAGDSGTSRKHGGWEMSDLRLIWVVWCVMWALGWLLIGFFTFFIGWIFVPLSLLA